MHRDKGRTPLLTSLALKSSGGQGRSSSLEYSDSEDTALKQRGEKQEENNQSRDCKAGDKIGCNKSEQVKGNEVCVRTMTNRASDRVIQPQQGPLCCDP